MGTILLSTAYLPPISWIRAALSAEKVCIEAHETYPKQTYRNRCRILAANGVLPLSIPVSKVDGKNTRTKDIEVFYEEPWQRLHWKSIDAAYSNSPFYLYYRDELERFYQKKYRFLLDLNMEITQTIFGIFGKSIDLELTTEFEHSPEGMEDLRNSISPKLPIDEAQFPRYPQVFEERFGFRADLCIIDLLFNEGPATLNSLGTRH